ncbi:MAG TPA: helicase-associated domain-containing protein [Aggregatilineales bacterium]|nr:helicase-associated domain-containing protein [Aggregatilineales bacterium]
MRDLLNTLSDYDLELLRVIANRWDIDLNTRDHDEAAARLAQAMLSVERTQEVWDRLTDEQRGALQTLLGAGGRMPNLVFARLFGEIRPVGPGRLEREKPYLNPVSLAEALYYRGLIASSYEEGAKSTLPVTYIPTDLMPLLPSNRTSYDLSPEPAAEPLDQMPSPENIRLADTAIVDDMTTLLAYCQIYDVPLAGMTITGDHQKALKAHFIGSNSPARLALLVALASGLGIAAESEAGFKPVSAARKWLDSPRPVQVRTLAEAWCDSTLYNELWYTPGIKPERASWENDPLLARQTVLTFLELVPAEGWWPVDAFINAVKEEEPDFQRPGGDYDSWYIRDAATGAYLRGFESWDKVDGAVLRFILSGPLHGLGLLDVAQDGSAYRLTAYGRAFAGIMDWPVASAEPDSFTVRSDGLCEISRGTSRYVRFQLARFTEWIKAGDPYQYRISAAGLAQAREQNIQPTQIVPFLKRSGGESVPDAILAMIETWGSTGEETSTLSQMVVLRVPSPELLDSIMANPALRRYLSSVLGPQAVAVRAGQWRDLMSALNANGIPIEPGEGLT